MSGSFIAGATLMLTGMIIAFLVGVDYGSATKKTKKRKGDDVSISGGLRRFRQEIQGVRSGSFETETENG